MSTPGTGGEGRPIVWHVSEAMGGGITTAVNAFVDSAPEYDHELWCVERPAHRTGEEGRFSAVHAATGTGPLGLWRLLSEARSASAPAPDVVHLHSSWAGLIGRRMLADWSSRIVYSPHCYWFERTDKPAPVVRLAERIERRLAGRTAVTVAVSPHEARLARQLGSPAAFVPNAAHLPSELLPQVAFEMGLAPGSPVPTPVDRSGGRPARLVTVGRVEAQKDPRFFARTIDDLRARGVDVEATWVGGGAPELEAVLHDSGVAVTGWVDRAAGLEHVTDADVYVHTAAWEGNPLTVLEALAMDKPVAVRSIAAMTSLGHVSGNSTPEALSATIRSVLAHSGTRPAPLPDEAPVSLSSVYDQVAAAGRAVGTTAQLAGQGGRRP